MRQPVRMGYVTVLHLALVLAACRGSDNFGEFHGWTVDRQPTAEIGSNVEAEGHDLYNVRAAMRLRDGVLVVADEGSSEVRFFDARGRYQAAIGSGSGANAIRRIQNARRGPEETLLVRSLDPALVRISGPERRVLERMALPAVLTDFQCRQTGDPQVMADGTLLILAHESGGRDCTRVVGRTQTQDLLARYDLATGKLDTIAILPGQEQTDRGWVTFPRTLAVAHFGNRVFAGETGSDSIRVFGADNSLESVWRITLGRGMVEPAVREQDGSDSRVSWDVPALYPRFARLLADEVGNLWVMAYPPSAEPRTDWALENGPPLQMPSAPGGDRWVVLDPNGQEVARVRTPPGLRLLEIGADYILGVARTWKNAEVVRLHHLAK